MRNPLDDPILREQIRRAQELQNNPAYQQYLRLQNDPAYQSYLRLQERLDRDPAYRYFMREQERLLNDFTYQHLLREQERLLNNPAYQQLKKLKEDARNYQTGIDLYNYLERERQTTKSIIEINQTDRLWKEILQLDQLRRYESLFNDTRSSATIYYASTNAIFQRFRETESLTPRNSKYIEKLIEPIKNYAHFATDTLNQLANAKLTNRESAALRASLTISENQITQLTAAITPIIVPPTETFRIRLPRVKFNLLEIQQKELLEQSESISEDAAYEDLTSLTPSSELANDALDCITLYERCNEARRFKGEELIFKPTTRGTLAAAWIVFIVADSKDKFEFFIDQLYMLFYEGTGATKIKLLKENGGVMEKNECDVLWDIKHLRSKRARHDIEHGSEGDIKKKYREVAETHKRYGLDRFPQTPEEYKLLQHNLLKKLKAFLREIAERIEE